MLCQMLSVRRQQARHPFSFGNELFQDHARNGMKVTKIDDRFRQSNRSSNLWQEIPAEHQMAPNVIADGIPLQHAALYQLLRRMDGSDEHKVGFRLSQIASLG